MPGAYTNLLCHFVFSTKERRSLIRDEIKTRLFPYVGGILNGEEGALIEGNGTADHVHLFVRLHPTKAVADMLRLIKSNSSKWVHESFSNAEDFAWQEGYAAFTVSQSQAEHLVNYVRRQEEHHRKTDFKSELIALLRRHEIEFEERYLW
jgi:putative transposase